MDSKYTYRNNNGIRAEGYAFPRRRGRADESNNWRSMGNPNRRTRNTQTSSTVFRGPERNPCLNLEDGGSNRVPSPGERERRVTAGLADLKIANEGRKVRRAVSMKKKIAANQAIKRAKETRKRNQREKEKRRVKREQALCYNCNEIGHYAVVCPNKHLGYPKPNKCDEFLVHGTDGGSWNDIWYVSPNLKHHMTGNREIFTRFKRAFGVETHESENDFVFIHGVGEIKLVVEDAIRTIHCVYYVPKHTKNSLSLDQLTHQGLEVVFDGEKCFIERTIKRRHVNDDVVEAVTLTEIEDGYLERYFERVDKDIAYERERAKLESYMQGWFDREEQSEGDQTLNIILEEGGDENMIEIDEGEDVKDEHFKKQKEALVEYLDLMKEDPTVVHEEKRKELWSKFDREKSTITGESILILNEDSVESCINFLELLKVHDLFMKYKMAFHIEFKRLVEWFMEDHIRVLKKESFPPRLRNGSRINILDLYLKVQHEGGCEKACDNGKWGLIAESVGFSRGMASDVKLAYVKYLDLLEYYYYEMKDRVTYTKEEADEITYCKKEIEKKKDAQEGDIGAVKTQTFEAPKWKKRKVSARRDFLVGCGLSGSQGMEFAINKDEESEPEEQEDEQATEDEDYVILDGED